jgi:lipopolysaccharide transport system ATP-binding protein
MALKLFSKSKPKREPVITIPADCTCFHITHWKAGSQWVGGILKDAFAGLVVKPAGFEEQVLNQPIKTGRVYSCAYLAESEYRTIDLPANARRVVIVRDLRDTLISGYFSVRNTHVINSPWMAKWRAVLTKMSEEDGLLYLLEVWLTSSVLIQRSWADAGEPLVQLEAFMSNPAPTMKRVLRDFWKLNVDDAVVDALMDRNAYSKYSGGRKPGEEDASSHYRKGVAGDWQNHFTPRVKDRFKQLCGDLLIRTGYEKDLNW